MIPCSPHLFTADSTMIVLIFPSFVPTIFKRGSFIKLLTLFIHDFNSHGSMNHGQNSFFWKAHGFDDLSRIVNYTDSCGWQLTAPWSRGSTTVNTDSKLALEVLRVWIPTQVVVTTPCPEEEGSMTEYRLWWYYNCEYRLRWYNDWEYRLTDGTDRSMLGGYPSR